MINNYPSVPCARCDGSGELDCSCWEEGLAKSPDDDCRLEEGHSCPNCRGTGQSDVVYANVYSVTRHYGGCEEGGWWYNHYEPIGSIKIDPSWDRQIVGETLNRLYADHKEGDIYSVLGGTDVSIIFENHFAEAQPQSRPRYE